MFLGVESELGQVPSICHRPLVVGTLIGQVGHTHHGSLYHHFMQALSLKEKRCGGMEI